MSLDELYENGYSEQFRLDDVTVHMNSMIAKKRFGTAIVSLCFVNHYIPIVRP